MIESAYLKQGDGATNRYKRLICFIMVVVVFAFICESDHIEQGSFIHSIQNAGEDAPVSLSVAVQKEVNTDAITELSGSWAQPIELRISERQAERAARFYELVLLLLAIWLIQGYFRGMALPFGAVVIPGEDPIIGYMQNQDGKK